MAIHLVLATPYIGFFLRPHSSLYSTSSEKKRKIFLLVCLALDVSCAKGFRCEKMCIPSTLDEKKVAKQNSVGSAKFLLHLFDVKIVWFVSPLFIFVVYSKFFLFLFILLLRLVSKKKSCRCAPTTKKKSCFEL